MILFGEARPRRRPSLTPMIDVVFLLLVFFMLAARFGSTGVIPSDASGLGHFDGIPRLIEVSTETVSLNGNAIRPDGLAAALDRISVDRDALVVLRPVVDVTFQAIVDVLGTLSEAGFTRVTLVEGAR